MSYGTNFSDLFLRAADYPDKILRGASQRTYRSNSRPNSTLRSV
jgi:hypothetical protein